MLKNRRPAKGDGSDCQRGSDSSEPTPKQQIAQCNDCPPAMDAISVFAPWSGEAERALRIRIHRARDSATARATRCKHGDARSLFWIAAQLASARVFARMPDEELMETIDNLARLFLVAAWIERTDAPDAE